MDLSRLPAIRPQTPTATQATRDVSAAQRAFFQAALGKALEAEPVPAPQPTPQAAAEAMSQTAEQPRFPRPGSIIDIRV
jgi:hypothetical protein